MRRLQYILVVIFLFVEPWAQAQVPITARLEEALHTAHVAVVGVIIGNEGDKSTWKVQPSTLQSAAQPIINAFNINDPKHTRAEADAEVDTNTLLGDVVTAMLRHWPEIQADITAGTYKEAVWKQRILSTARQLRRTRKGV